VSLGGDYGAEGGTVDSVDAYDIFDDRGALVGGLPVQQHAICLDAGERDEGRDGDLEAEQVDELLDGLGQHAVGAEGDPRGPADQRGGRRRACNSARAAAGGTYQNRARSTQAVFSRGQEDEGVHVVAGDVRGPVQRVRGVGEHGDGWQASQASPACLGVCRAVGGGGGASSVFMRRRPALAGSGR
jgi:hypothetical protein